MENEQGVRARCGLSDGGPESLENFLGAVLLEEAEVQYQLSLIYAHLLKDEAKAVAWLRKAAEGAHAQALFELGERYARGLGVEEDGTLAHACYEKSMNKGHIGAQYALGLIYESGSGGIAPDNKLAIRRFKKAADRGHVEAQYHLGKMYCEGRVVMLNKPWGCQLLHKASSRGHKEAGRLYKQYYEKPAPRAYTPSEIAQEDKKWLKSLEKSAEGGSECAQLRLAALYREGLRIPRNAKLAKKWYKRAYEKLLVLAEAGNADAQWQLAELYREGLGVGRAQEEAEAWYKKAADNYMQTTEQRHADIQYRLGEMYLRGRGVAKSKAKALEWFRRAAAQGHMYAQYYIGRSYARGECDTPRELPKAIEWYTKAAEQGHSAAQFYLREIYLKESGAAEEKPRRTRRQAKAQ